MSHRIAISFALASSAELLAAQAAPPVTGLALGAEIRVCAEANVAARCTAGWLVGLSPSTITVAERGWTIDTLARSGVALVQVRQGGGWIDLTPQQVPTTLSRATAPAGTHPLPPPGTRLRISSAGRRVEGTLARWERDTAFLAAPDGTVHAASIQPDALVEVFAGRHGAAGAGFVVGFALGGIGLGAASAAACSGLGGTNCGGSGVAGAALGGVVTGALGAAIGSALRSDSWIVVPRDTLRAWLDAQATGHQ